MTKKKNHYRMRAETGYMGMAFPTDTFRMRFKILETVVTDPEVLEFNEYFSEDEEDKQDES